MLARMAGLSCGKEVRNLMLHSCKRPDVAIFGALRNIITDVRTVVGADPRYCADAAVFPVHGGLWGAMRKNEAWLGQTMPGRRFLSSRCATRPVVTWATLLTTSSA